MGTVDSGGPQHTMQPHTINVVNVFMEATVQRCAGRRERGQVSSQDRGQI